MWRSRKPALLGPGASFFGRSASVSLGSWLVRRVRPFFSLALFYISRPTRTFLIFLFRFFLEKKKYNM